MDSITPISASPSTGHTTSQGRGGQPEQNLPSWGQILKGIIVANKGDSRFTLRINEQLINVRSALALKTGDTIQLQVTKTTPQLEFTLLSDTLGQFTRQSITAIGKPVDLSGLFTALQNNPDSFGSLTYSSKAILQTFFSLQQNFLTSPAQEQGKIFKQLTENLGLNLEKFLFAKNWQETTHTLKNALLELVNSTKPGDAQSAGQKLLTTLELFQLSQLHTANDSQIIFPLPFSFVEQGYLVFERKQQGSDDKSGNEPERRFSLHLTMSAVGNIQVDFMQYDSALKIMIRTSSSEISDFFKLYKDELEKKISQFSPVEIFFKEQATDPIRQLIDQLIPQGQSILNTTA